MVKIIVESLKKLNRSFDDYFESCSFLFKSPTGKKLSKNIADYEQLGNNILGK